MRKLIFAAMLVVLPALVWSKTVPAKKATTVASPVKVLPVFSFQGEDTNGTYDCAATAEENGSKMCVSSPEFVGAQTSLVKTYYNGKLHSIYIPVEQDRYLAVLSALRAKYGPPDKLEVVPWASRGGAKMDNEVSTWNFAGHSRLKISSVGGKIGESLVEFRSDDNAPPAQAAKVDF